MLASSLLRFSILLINNIQFSILSFASLISSREFLLIPKCDIANWFISNFSKLSRVLNKISLSAVSALIMKSEDALLKLPNEVPPSFNIMSVPSASRIISPDESSLSQKL